MLSNFRGEQILRAAQLIPICVPAGITPPQTEVLGGTRYYYLYECDRA